MEAERNRRKQLLDTQAQVNVAEGEKGLIYDQSRGGLNLWITEGHKQRVILESEGHVSFEYENQGSSLTF